MRPILFDFNGTLYNDTPFHIMAWKNFFAENIGIDLTYEEVRDICMGPANEAILRRMIGADITDAQIEAYSKVKESAYRSVCLSKPENKQLIEGVPEMFEMLQRRSVKYVLASTSGIDNINFYLNDLGLNRWFTMDNIVYDDGYIPNKPDPAFYRKAAELVDAEPRDCIIVEDSRTGLQAAINAGATTIIAMDRTMTEEQFAAYPQISTKIHDFYGFEELMDSLQ